MKVCLPTRWMLLLSLTALVVGACKGDEILGECSDHTDCTDGYYCGPDHQCLCQTDAACPEDQFCNASGYCQNFLGCRIDADCGDPANVRCEIESTGKGNCLCRNDSACLPEEYCNASGVCQKKAGCILDSDCGDVAEFFCRINEQTRIGECFCKADAACEQGEFCNPNGYCQPLAVCTTNDDCPAGKLCDVPSGECLCDHATQSGCKADEICNTSGYCQPRPGCYDNSDCDAGVTFCDIVSRTCIPVGTCNSDLQCPLGQICRQNVCIDGCNTSDDCPLTQCCSGSPDFQCADCDCQNDDFCEFAEFCNNETCETAYTANTPYCKPCDHVTEQCGDSLNRCLIYPFDDDEFAQQHPDNPAEYCAVDCSANDRCPKGFSCNSIIVVSGTCVTNNDCPFGVPCWKGPEEDHGYCPCHDTSNPCPIDMCGLFTKTCINKGIPCQTDADCVIECETDRPDELGGCVVGKTCGLEEGMHCPYPFP
ncbi:MAG: hypothetical protein JRJ87_03610 [Deltaproteobacteria bacterium]|nr:hypothetical protein [Deltaproteobacteria bacterium]